MKRVFTILFLLVITVFFNAVTVFAVDESEYRELLTKAHGTVVRMIDESESASWVSGKHFDAAAIVQVRQLLPVKLQVDTKQGTVEVSNQWLHSRLDQYITEENSSKQFTILIDIEERMSAIMWKLDEMANAAESNTSKDQAKQKLSEILSREEYQKPSEKEKSRFEQWISDFLNWLSGLFPKAQIEPSSTGMPNVAYWLQMIVLIIAAALLGFGIYKVAPFIFPTLRRKRKSENEDRVILGETIEAGRSSDDLYAEADTLARSGDMRGAIRKGYIALLFDLSKKKQIGLARHKTNRDYLGDVRKKPELYTDMKTLTGVYEAHWYGVADSDESAWSGFKKLCREASGRV